MSLGRFWPPRGWRTQGGGKCPLLAPKSARPRLVCTCFLFFFRFVLAPPRAGFGSPGGGGKWITFRHQSQSQNPQRGLSLTDMSHFQKPQKLEVISEMFRSAFSSLLPCHHLSLLCSVMLYKEVVLTLFQLHLDLNLCSNYLWAV